MPDLQIKDGKVVYLDDSSPANTVYKLPTADGTTAQVIKTDGSGNLSFGDVSGTISISGSYGNSIIVNSDEDGGVSTNILHVDVSNSRVGINDTTPSYSLDVNGTFRTTGNSILGDASGDSLTINAGSISLNPALGSGSTSTVLIYNSGIIQLDTVDSRVFGSTLVDGSGTTNYVTKWSDSNTVTNSLITDDGSTVTVGGNLTVTGTTTTVNTTNTTITDNLLELNSGASSNSNDSGIIIERGSTGDNGLFIWDESADKFALGTTTGTASSTGNITYTDAGLIVGTLDISGDIDVDGTANLDVVDIDGAVDMASTLTIDNDLIFTNRVTTDGHIQLYNGSSSTGYAIGVEGSTLYQRSNDYFRWYIDSFADGGTSDYMELSTTALTVNAGLNVSGDAAFDTDTLFVDVSADRVGINDSTPSYSLDVNGTGRFTSTVRFDGQTQNFNGAYDIYRSGAGYLRHRIADQTLSIGVTNTSDTVYYPIVIDTPNDVLKFNNEEGEMARFDTSGNLGIGTESPNAKLQIKTSASEVEGISVLNAGNTSEIFKVIEDGSNGGYVDIRNSSNTSIIRLNSSSDSYFNGGNVGIGTSAPGTALDIHSATGELSLNSTGSTYSRIKHEHNGTAIWTTGTRASDDYHLYRESGSGDVIIDSGNVGIGTTSPDHKLSVFGDSSGNRTEIGIDNIDQRLVLGAYFETGVTQYSTIQATNNAESSGTNLALQPDGGNVGIGTASPAYKLDINDDASTGAGLRVTGGGAGAAIARFERDVGSSGCFVDISCSSGDPQIRFTESSGVDWAIGVEGNVFEIVDGNSLTGSSKFEINSTGDATIAGDITVQGGIGTFGVSDTTQGHINIYGGPTGGEGGEIRIFNNADDDSPPGYEYWRVDSDGAGQFRIGRAGTTDLTVNQSGNFGIGTTSAGDKLEVGGDITLDATNANIKLKAGSGNGTNGAINWTFDSDSTIYGSIDLDYEDRSAQGLRLRTSSYAITIDSGNGINFREDGTTHSSFDSSGNLTVNDLDLRSQFSSLRANVNVSGGGTLTFDSSSYFKWSTRFIVISNGRGSYFSTSGYFDITCPTSGTITGVGGATNKTATSDGIPLSSWEALYYILPIGSTNATVAANFRVAKYTSDLVVPSNWLLLAVRNADHATLHVINRYQMKAGGYSINTSEGIHGGRGNISDGTHTTGDAGYFPGYHNRTYGHEIEASSNGTTLHLGRETGSLLNLGADANATVVYFRNTNSSSTPGSVATAVGSISITSSATAFNTSSDYRLKENEVSITDGIDRIKQLSPKRFNFIAEPEKTVDGFFAHEVSNVVPEAINGEKDAMKDEEYEVTPAVYDDEGELVTERVMGTRSVPDYQGIDQSKLVPLLTAALQEAITKIEENAAEIATLKTQVAALTSNSPE